MTMSASSLRHQLSPFWKIAALAVTAACVAPAAGDVPPGTTGDGDLISDAVELNPPNKRLYNFDITVNNLDPSRALRQVGSGTLQSGINLPDNHANYYHYLGSDATDTDDWGTLKLLNLAEIVALDWGDPTRPCVFNDDFPPRKFGILDLSKGTEATRSFGGPFPPHTSHQNGRDIDVRYLRTDNADLPLDLATPDINFYDNRATADLISCFGFYSNVEFIFVDTRYTNIDFGGDPRIQHDPTHHDHFHVRIVDPDGTAN